MLCKSDIIDAHLLSERDVILISKGCLYLRSSRLEDIFVQDHSSGTQSLICFYIVLGGYSFFKWQQMMKVCDIPLRRNFSI